MHTVPLTHEPAVPELLWGGKTAFHAPLAMLLKGDNPPVVALKNKINKKNTMSWKRLLRWLRICCESHI